MRYLIIVLIVIMGVGLIYLAALYLFPKTSPKEISFEPEETTAAKEMPGGEETEYTAPNFELPDLEGEKNRLPDYKNKIVVLTFWTTWNPAAQDQIVILESYFQEIKDDKNIVLLTINNLEDKSIVSNFIKRGGYVLPVLLDENGRVGELYGINTLPATFFINREGKVKETYVGILSKEEIKNRVEKLYQ